MRIVCRIALWVGIVLVAMMIVLLVRLDPAGVFTVVPSGFSRGNWAKIHKGMSKDEVLELLPLPIKRGTSQSNRCAEYWRYSRNRFRTFMMYRDYTIFFDKNGHVVGTRNAIDCD